MAFNNNWGKDTETKLKYKYVSESDKYNSKVKKRTMSKKELEEYLKGLEVKNRWKTRKVL